MKNEIRKPITVAREDFISSLATLINESGLAPFIIEPILKDMYMDVKSAAKKQLDSDMAKYMEAINSKE